VYVGVLSRTNIDIDDDAVQEVMALFDFRTKKEAVNFALNQLRRKPLTADEILALNGIGWGEDGLELSDIRPGYPPYDE
jgi:Arc/MetJ family transcription regulator